ncbi:AAA domain-containing protein [Pseudobutyrivibrio sp. 49]|uniref:AAA domain-containing protein n=1 Tax=Pseudobutyrivibrio sp. 49 TaxID=1855344 RepID=UPI00088D9B6E|nr:AAA domain-containing protein [Pseudobutyrivibrio sp. 49]SDH83656.1 AAA domain-containing protein [Pseudobutyrivibrio sp. 49]
MDTNSEVGLIIDKFKRDVLREKYYLQEEGGRRYKLVNGRLIGQKNDYSTYSFEMEAELNLPDDAPITLTVGKEVVKGVVFLCEGFQIIVSITKNFGNAIGQAFVGVEPWALLEGIVDQLETITTADKLVIKLLQEGPELATNKPISMVPKGQDAAVEMAIDNDITVIWGPPGTGKTYTMAQIAIHSLLNRERVLVVSHSNISVDGIVKQTASLIRDLQGDKLLKMGAILRYGYVRDEELAKDNDVVAYNYAVENNQTLKNEYEKLRKKRDHLVLSGKYNTAEGVKVEQELKDIRKKIREEEKLYVKNALMVATTISKVTMDKLFEDNKYSVVMFDEVSMAYMPQILIAAKHAYSRLVLVGDFRQLAPIVQSNVKETLGKDVFSYLGIEDDRSMHAHPWLVMLNEQRRMYPDISAFANEYVYNDLLTDHESVVENRQEIVDNPPFNDESINLIDLAGTYCACMKNNDNSRFNIVSAIISFLLALEAEKYNTKSVGIITPYAAQTRLVRAMIQDYRESKETDISCATVHQFQGSERDVIIFDAVESYPSTRVGFLLGKSFNAVTRLINVAVTRARGKLVVVANAKYWNKRFGKSDHVLYKLIEYLQKKGNVVSSNERRLQDCLSRLPETKQIQNYMDAVYAMDDLCTDIAKARKQIVISIPDGELDIETEANIFDALIDAKMNGIKILCKSKDIDSLPDNWKKISVPSDNAVFPLILIDDKVMWYGLPKSKGTFRDGTSESYVVCQTIYRISGSHTIELIKAFSDLELQVYDGSRTAIQNAKSIKNTTSTDGVNVVYVEDEAGMADYVHNKLRCAKCGSPMNLTRSRSGKCFLKCSSKGCGETALLDKDVANAYLNKNNVKCSKCNCMLQAGVSKYGLYVKCSNGHFFKPDEV